MKRLPNKVQSIPIPTVTLHYGIGDEVNWNFIPGQVIWTNTIDTVWMTVDGNGHLIRSNNNT